jgi:hypothetical protein
MNSFLMNSNNFFNIHKLFSSAQRLASCFDSITYTYSYRENNHMVDHLAKQGVHRISDFVAWLWLSVACGILGQCFGYYASNR